MDPIAVGQQFFQEIEAKRSGNNWTWQHYLKGPIDTETANIICRVAGCWVYDPGEENVRFYVNQNHPDHGGKQ